jgi:CBS domain-containing protein
LRWIKARVDEALQFRSGRADVGECENGVRAMQVKSIMTSPVVTVRTTTPLMEAVALMGGGGLSGLAVVDDVGSLCGILSEGDLLRRIEFGTSGLDGPWWSRLFTFQSVAEVYNRTTGRRVGDVMSKDPITIGPNDDLADAARLMEKHRIKRLPVVADGGLVGMLSRADFVDLLKQFIAPAYEEAVVSDAEIRRRILEEIAHQRWGSACFIEVAVLDGRVTLTGSVPSDDRLASARIAAENVVGVVSVDERIEVFAPIAMQGM